MQPSPLLHESTLASLQHTKNLLAFSGGGDSTALFFLLHVKGISFDIAHVNYQTRPQSQEEEAYAKELSLRFNKNLFTFTCKLKERNFEHHARHVRYEFFESLIHEHGYGTLIMAHHLGDQLEWFLMQLCKGAGLVEMIGMREWEKREAYTIVRPLLHVSKAHLKDFLEKEKIHFFEDESNASFSHLRNTFRHRFATPLLEAYEAGIAKSFAYLDEDTQRLLPKRFQRIKELFIIPLHDDDLINIRQIDKALKILGFLASTKERHEILQTRNCVVGHTLAVVFGENAIYIAPYRKTPLTKHEKETYRKAKIPAKIRAYLASEGIDINEVVLR